MEEPVERIRNFYVTAKDVGPKFNGVGFTEGCKGCRAIVNGKSPVAHSHDCRLRVMEQAPNNDKIAAMVKRTVSKDQDLHARSLERNEEKRKKDSEGQPPSVPAVVEGGSSEITSRAQVGGSSSSSGSSAPAAVPVPTSRKRGAGDQLDQASEPPGSQPSGAEASSPQGDPLARSGAVKRPAEGEPESRWRTGSETGPQSQEDEAK